MTQYQAPAWARCMPFPWRVAADLVLTPEQMLMHQSRGFLPMMQLCWELSGTLLLGAEPIAGDRVLRYPEICLGPENRTRAWPAVVSDAVKLAALRGWTLTQTTRSSEASGGKQWQILPGMDKPAYPPGTKLTKLHLSRPLIAGGVEKQRASATRPLPEGLIPSVASHSTLSQVAGSTTMRLLWMVVRSVLCKNSLTTRFGQSAGLLYSVEDWQAVEVILSSRGWKMTKETDSEGAYAYLEEMTNQDQG